MADEVKNESSKVIDFQQDSTSTTPGSLKKEPSVRQPVKSNFLTRSKIFKNLAASAFKTCDAGGSGKVERDELYAGILLVHLKLAKSFGAAACYPPSRETVNELFDASDHDDSGAIDEEEFQSILVSCCSEVSGRILVYFLMIMTLVPILANGFINATLGLESFLASKFALHTPNLYAWTAGFVSFDNIVHKLVSTCLSFLAVPILYDFVHQTAFLAGHEVAQATEYKKNK